MVGVKAEGLRRERQNPVAQFSVPDKRFFGSTQGTGVNFEGSILMTSLLRGSCHGRHAKPRMESSQ